MLLLVLNASPVRADVRDDARALALAGIRLLEAGKPEEAIAKLELAESTFHAPPHLLYIARAQRRMGRLVDAHRTLVRVMAEDLLSEAPDAFKKAQRDAAVEATDLISKVPSLVIEIDDGTAPYTAAVDGYKVTSAELEYPVAVDDTGRHEVVVTDAEGNVEAVGGIDAVTPGTRVAVAVRYLGEAPPDTPLSDSEGGVADGGGRFPVLGTVILSLGVAGLIGGAVTGALTLSEAKDIKASCVDDVCPTALEDDADSAKTLGNVSTGLCIAGGIVAAAGLAVLVVELTNEDDLGELGVLVGPGSLALIGRF